MDRYSNGLKEDIHVVMVEDETIIAMGIQQCLEEFGYIVDEVASSTEEAIFYVDKYKPNIVLMDIQLNGSPDGIEVVDLIQQKYKVPVIYLTSYSDDATLKRAESTKPYGYIIKPIDENQLNITIRMALSRYKEEQKELDGEIVKLSDSYTYNKKSKELYYLEEKVKLTKKEGEFFSYMINNLNSTISYDDIVKNVWYNEDTTIPTLRSLVRRVRNKLNEDLIESVSSKGYKIAQR